MKKKHKYSCSRLFDQTNHVLPTGQEPSYRFWSKAFHRDQRGTRKQEWR
jgi:hypothetical protein